MIKHDIYCPDSSLQNTTDPLGICKNTTLLTFLQDFERYCSPFLSRYEYEPPDIYEPKKSYLTLYGLGGQKLLRLTLKTKYETSNQPKCYIDRLEFYKPDGSIQSFGNVYTGTGGEGDTTKAYLSMMASCINGAFIEFSESLNDRHDINEWGSSRLRTVAIMITKDNHNPARTFIVATTLGNPSLYRAQALSTNLICFAEGDGSDDTKTEFATCGIKGDRSSIISNITQYSDTLCLKHFRSVFERSDECYTPYAYYKERGLNEWKQFETITHSGHVYMSNGVWVLQD